MPNESNIELKVPIETALSLLQEQLNQGEKLLLVKQAGHQDYSGRHAWNKRNIMLFGLVFKDLSITKDYPNSFNGFSNSDLKVCVEYLQFLNNLIEILPHKGPNSPLPPKTIGSTSAQPTTPMHTSSNNITIGGNVSGATIIIGNQNTVIQRILEPVYEKIDHSNRASQEKQDLKADVLEIEGEIIKGELANESFLSRRLRSVKKMAPDIGEVILATLSSPSAGAATIVRKIAEKIKSERL